MDNPSTRQQVMTILRKDGPLSANELAKALGITDIAVRRHLNTLERDRMLRVETVRQAMGRPLYMYSLTEEAENAFPKHYADITLEILKDVQDMQGPEMIDAIFERREGRLELKYKERIETGMPLEVRVEQLSQLQEDRGYMAEWFKAEDGSRYFITEHNCPIHSIAQNFTQACDSELSLFRKVLGAEVEQLECKAKGGSRCIYEVRPKQ